MEESRDPEFPAARRPLHEDVSRLGAMVGPHAGRTGWRGFFQRVEQVRTAAIRVAARALGGRSRRSLAGLDAERCRGTGACLRHVFSGGEHRRARAPHPPSPRLPARRQCAAARIAARCARSTEGARRGRRRIAGMAQAVGRAGVHRASHRSGAPLAAGKGAGHRACAGR
jgi:hypothetical protein